MNILLKGLMLGGLVLLTGCGPVVSYTLCRQGVLDCRSQAEKAAALPPPAPTK